MGKAAKKKARGKPSRPPEPVLRHDDWGPEVSPEVEAIIRLVNRKQQDPLPAKPHRWGVRMIVELAGGEDRAHALAAGRVEGAVPYVAHPDDMHLQVEGPVCLDCSKLRGPLSATTLCGQERPEFRKQQVAEAALEGMVRRDRRDAKTVMRRREAQHRKDPLMPTRDEVHRAAVVSSGAPATEAPIAGEPAVASFGDPDEVVFT